MDQFHQNWAQNSRGWREFMCIHMKDSTLFRGEIVTKLPKYISPHLTYPLRAHWHIRPRYTASIFAYPWLLFLLTPSCSNLALFVLVQWSSSMLFYDGLLFFFLLDAMSKQLYISGFYPFLVHGQSSPFPVCYFVTNFWCSCFSK